MVYSNIIKRNSRQQLGRFNRQLVIRLNKTRNPDKVYHFVLCRQRSRAGSRLDKLGFFHIFKNNRKAYNVLGLNRRKIRLALSHGAIFHVSVYKILMK